MKRRTHPTLEDWLDWIHERMNLLQAQEMERHLQSCSRCVDDFPMLRHLRKANRFHEWTLPPETLLKRATRQPKQPMPPERPVRSQELAWQPADIRGRTLVAAPEPGTLNAVLSGAEVSIVAVPPAEDPFWEIEGRVWLREHEDEPIEIVVLEGDHVIVHRTVRNAEFFRIREIFPPGWELEVHLPDSKTLKLTDRDS